MLIIQHLMRIALGALLAIVAASASASASDTAVTIDNFTFSPATVTVTAGSRVVWTNRDDIPHTVTSADEPRAVKSEPLDTGDTFTHVFAKRGTFHYFCSLHPHMQGTIVVQ
jgi:plastocyanin